MPCTTWSTCSPWHAQSPSCPFTRPSWKSHGRIFLSVLTGGSKGVHQRTSTIIQKLWQNLGRRLVWFQNGKLMKMKWLMPKKCQEKVEVLGLWPLNNDNGLNYVKIYQCNIYHMFNDNRTVCHHQPTYQDLFGHMPRQFLKVMMKANNSYD